MNIIRLVGGVFSLVGASLLLAAGTVAYQAKTFSETAVKTTGVVTEHIPVRSSASTRSSTRSGESTSLTYAARVRFSTDDGRDIAFTETTSSSPPRHAVGDRVEVMYTSGSPSDAVIDDTWGRYGVSLIIGPLGTLFFVLGSTLYIVGTRNGKRRAQLRQTGQRIEAEVINVYRDTSLSRNGEHPYRIVAQATDPRSQNPVRYESEALWVDPIQYLASGKIGVFVDPLRRDRYAMDTERFQT